MFPIGDRGEFFKLLNSEGYLHMRPSDAYLCAQVCKHKTNTTYYLYNIPGTICFPDDSVETLADIGWEVMSGCKDCFRNFLGVLTCGGHYLGLHVFQEDTDISEQFQLPAFERFPGLDMSVHG